MRVLWIDLVSELGGAQYSLLEVCGGLSAHGVDVAAAVPRGPLSDALSAKGIPVYPVTPLRASKTPWGLLAAAVKLLRATGAVNQAIRAFNPRVIHANSLPAFFAATPAAIPAVWHVRDLRLPLLPACAAANRAARIIAASDAVADYLADTLPPRRLGHVRIIRNGIDPARFADGDRAAARRRFGLPADAPLVGMAAHLVPWKRHDAFIDAAAVIRARRPDAHFAAVGRDLFREHARWLARLKKRVEEARLGEAFHWVTDCADAAHILPAFDLLLHPAPDEPFGRVICEAMASAVPVIAAKSGGPADIIEPDVSGILVRDGDPRRMADAALALLSDPSRAAALAAAGRIRVLERFTAARVCAHLADEYRALTGE
jgi:glycosyltransferase involved in cell wall biosynthesis